MFDLSARVESTIFVSDGVERPWWKRRWMIVAGATLGFLALALIFLLLLHGGRQSEGPGHLAAVVERTSTPEPSATLNTEPTDTSSATSQPSSSPRPLTRTPRSAPRPPTVGSSGPLYQVISVTDGDTIRVSVNGSNERVRLIGIDTPETVDPNSPVECYGPQASNFAHQLMEGQRVRLVSDGMQSDRDRYGRLLRFVYTENGTSVNALLVLRGFATFEGQYPIAEPYRSELARAEAEAIATRAGMWRAC